MAAAAVPPAGELKAAVPARSRRLPGGAESPRASRGLMLKIIAIWVFGLLASAIVGMLVGAVLIQGGAGLGLIAGLAIFASVRLMLTMPR